MQRGAGLGERMAKFQNTDCKKQVKIPTGVTCWREQFPWKMGIKVRIEEKPENVKLVKAIIS